MEWEPQMLANNFVDDICINIDTTDFTQHCLLLRRENDWLMVYRDESWAVSAWAFESPELDDFLDPRLTELRNCDALFAPFAAGDDPIWMDSVTAVMGDISLHCVIPTSLDSTLFMDTSSWMVAHISHQDRYIHLYCPPYIENGWMEIRYYDTPQDLPNAPHETQPITLANGITGTLYHSGDPTRWELIVLDTLRGQLYATLQGENSTAVDRQLALATLGTLRLTHQGVSILGKGFQVQEPNLGITLHVENITRNSCALVCTQSGGPFENITTGSPFNLELLEDGRWVGIMPESTTWTSIAYGVNRDTTTSWNLNWSQIVGSLAPGHYRVSKTFWGESRNPFHLGEKKESGEQTYYAEFTIE
jgi:hypothetical protein